MTSGFFAVFSSSAARANLALVGPRAADVMDARLEERLRIVEGELLRVLAEAEEGRAAIGRDRA